MAKKLADVTSYEEASRFLGGKEEKTIAHNTKVVDHSRGQYGTNCFTVRLHWTDVLTFTKSGYVILNSGGYRTVTTKERINSFLPIGYRLFQENYEWKVCVRFGGFTETIPFVDGMKLPADAMNYDFK